MIEALKSAKKVVGLKQTKRALMQNQIAQIFLASDAEPHIDWQIRELCKIYHVSVEVSDSRKTLGKLCGIDVGASVVGIVKS